MKKALYIILSIIFGILLSFIIHGVIELIYLYQADKNNIMINMNQMAGFSCALPTWLSSLILILGIIFGIFLGFLGWKIAYIKSKI